MEGKVGGKEGGREEGTAKCLINSAGMWEGLLINGKCTFPPIDFWGPPPKSARSLNPHHWFTKILWVALLRGLEGKGIQKSASFSIWWGALRSASMANIPYPNEWSIPPNFIFLYSSIVYACGDTFNASNSNPLKEVALSLFTREDLLCCCCLLNVCLRGKCFSSLWLALSLSLSLSPEFSTAY